MKNCPVADIPQEMAREIQPFVESASVQGYYRFLSAMFHYTKNSGERLKHAAQMTVDSSESEIFHKLYLEEKDHYQLALNDLYALHQEVDEIIPRSVVEFNDFWMSRKTTAEWMGILFATENVASYLPEVVYKNILRLKLTENQCSFMLVHLKADAEHSSIIDKVVHDYISDEKLLESAKHSGELWIQMHIESFTRIRND